MTEVAGQVMEHSQWMEAENMVVHLGKKWTSIPNSLQT